jgi:DNA-binding transcriptional regulator YiaG
MLKKAWAACVNFSETEGQIRTMNKNEFSYVRTRLGKTQTQMAELLRTSPKAIQSYEQGWRPVPAHAERQILFLLSMKSGVNSQKPCWIVRTCTPEKKRNCPAWEFKAGKFCWFINGTMCEGKAQHNWQKKMQICRSCKVMASLLGSGNPITRRAGC